MDLRLAFSPLPVQRTSYSISWKGAWKGSVSGSDPALLLVQSSV